jgi:uncharacterized protein YlbG (UPF0298 family)
MKNVLTFLAVVALLVSCKSTVKVQGESFGEVVKVKQVVSYDELLTQIANTDKTIENVQVEGKVKKVCQKKGCWMTIYSDNGNSQEMMVKFKDYGFFMPLDISGKTVIMQGKAFKEVTSVDELRHYAEDAGDSKEEIAKITEPKTELKFEATGVVLKKAS